MLPLHAAYVPKRSVFRRMIIRLRSRDGLERVEIDAAVTVGELRKTISQRLSIPLEDCWLSRDPKLLTAKDPSPYTDMADNSKTLQQLGFANGELVHLLYHFERQVQAVAKPSDFERRPFGAKMTIDDMVALQTRIERQEETPCSSASFDRHAANMFQSYVGSALAFSIKRGALLYGVVEEDGAVKVHAVLEPPQQGSADSLVLERGTPDEVAADLIADVLGWRKVGWIFTQAVGERDYIMSSEEVCQMAAMQYEIGETCVTAVVSMVPSDDGGDVHFEAFQVSRQAVKLYKEGWFQQQPEPSGSSKLRNPKDPKDETPVIVAGKDAGEVDNDYFLLPLGILDHEGPLRSEFPIENRLLPQGKSELRAYLQKYARQPYAQRLADFHLLLYLARQSNWDLQTDMRVVVECVRDKEPIPEGYQLIVDSMAGL